MLPLAALAQRGGEPSAGRTESQIAVPLLHAVGQVVGAWHKATHDAVQPGGRVRYAQHDIVRQSGVGLLHVKTSVITDGRKIELAHSHRPPIKLYQLLACLRILYRILSTRSDAPLPAR